MSGWFVNRITQKLLNKFPPNSDGGCVSRQNRPHSFLVWFQIKGTDPNVVLDLFLEKNCFFNISINSREHFMEFDEKNQVTRWMVSISGYNMM